MEIDIQKATEEVETARTAVTESQEQIKDLKAKQTRVEVRDTRTNVRVDQHAHIVESQNARSVVAAKLDQERAALKAYQSQLDDLANTIAAIAQRIVDTELKIKTTEHELSNISKERTALETRVAEIEKLNPWFEDEKKYTICSSISSPTNLQY